MLEHNSTTKCLHTLYYTMYKQQKITRMGTHNLNLKCGSSQNVHTACYACTTNGQKVGNCGPVK
jgi:hypothetical protein